LAYRRRDDPAPAPDLVDAAAEVSTWAQGAMALTESALAWRAGDRPLAASLAQAAATGLDRAGLVDIAAVAGALGLLVGGRHDIEVLVQVAMQSRDPGLACQTLALAGWATGRAELLAGARERVTGVPARTRGLRLDVLSPDEACAERPPV